MSRQRIVEDGGRRTAGVDARRRLLAGVPVTERRLELAGVSTAVLEGGWEPFLAYALDRSRTPSVQRANRRLLRAALGSP
jgi:hypothetical protein